MQVIVPEGALAPTAQVIVELGACANAAALAIVNMDHAVELFVEEPGVVGQQEWPEAAAVAGNKSEIVGARAQVARVIGKIEQRHVPNVKRGVMGLDSLAGNYPDVLCPDFYGRYCDVIGRDQSVGGHINPVAKLGVEVLACDEYRRFASAKLFGLHLAGLEIVADVFSGPELLVLLDADVAIGDGLARRLIQRQRLGR